LILFTNIYITPYNKFSNKNAEIEPDKKMTEPVLLSPISGISSITLKLKKRVKR